MKEYIPPPQPPQPPQPVRQVAARSSLMWIAGAVVTVMFAIIMLQMPATFMVIVSESKAECMDKINQMNKTITRIRDECNYDYMDRNIACTNNGFEDALHNNTLSINTLNTSVIQLQHLFVNMNTTFNDSYAVLKEEWSNQIDRMNGTITSHRFDEVVHKGPAVKIELKEHSNRKHYSYYSHHRPTNLLQDNGDQYWSAVNKEFKANENDWIIFKLKQENTL
eukprot:500600_1